MHKDHLVVALLDRHLVAACSLQRRAEVRELVVVRGKQAAARNVGVQVLEHGPCDRQAVDSRCATANLIDDHERAIGGRVQDASRLGHLDHEGRAVILQVVRGADTAVNPVDDANVCKLCGYEAAHLRQDRNHCILAQEGALATHVRSADVASEQAHGEREARQPSRTVQWPMPRTRSGSRDCRLGS